MKHSNYKITNRLNRATYKGLILATLICSAIGSGCAHSHHGHWYADSLAPYPTPITNNAVTSVCNSVAKLDQDPSLIPAPDINPAGCTIYSFMGMTRPSEPASITPKSYKLSSPGKNSWQPIADATLLNDHLKIAASAVVCAGRIYLIGGYTIEEDGREICEKRFF